jgi:hypothetical protein
MRLLKYNTSKHPYNCFVEVTQASWPLRVWIYVEDVVNGGPHGVWPQLARGVRAPSVEKFALKILAQCIIFHANADVNMALPAHQRLYDDDTDEELSDEQVRELLKEAERSLRAKQAASQKAAADAPFKLPRLKPGHIADSSVTKDGKLDPSKLIDKEQRTLANGIKKIEDPIQVKKQKQQVRTICLRLWPMMIIIPFFFLKQTRVPFWVPSCIIEGFSFRIIVTLRPTAPFMLLASSASAPANSIQGEEGYCWL